jgi:hypothetical protein
LTLLTRNGCSEELPTVAVALTKREKILNNSRVDNNLIKGLGGIVLHSIPMFSLVDIITIQKSVDGFDEERLWTGEL